MRADGLSGPLCVVDPYSSGALIAPACAERGIGVVAVVSAPRPADVYAASYRPEDFPEILVFAGDLEPIVARLAELGPRAVIAGTESGVELADRLAARVAPWHSNVPSLSAARRDKCAMGAAVASAGLPSVPQVCAAETETVADWIEREGLHGADLVIKPARSAATDGVTKVAGGQDWRGPFEGQLGRRNVLGERNERVVVQRFLTGTEYVLDTFSHDGQHTLASACRYHKVDNGEQIAVYDALEWLPPDHPALPTLVAYCHDALDAVGIRFGSAHVELMLTESGPRLVELAARPHGGGNPRLCELATGDSQVARTLAFLSGRPVADSYRLRRHQLAVFLIAREAGVVRNAEVLDEARSLPSLAMFEHHVTNGQLIGPTRSLADTFELGFAVLSHPSRAQVWVDYRRLREIEARLELAEPEWAGGAAARG